jgi:hypothetical protein
MRTALLLAALSPVLLAHDVMGWIPPYNLEASRQAIAHKAGAVTLDQCLTRMGLQFWLVSPEGTLSYAERGEKLSDKDVALFRDWARAHGVKVQLTVYNHDGKAWDWARARSAFGAHRATFVKSLVAEMERLDLDGVDLDLEGEGSFDADRAAYGEFVAALSTALRAKGRLLTVDSFHSPCANAPNMSWWSDWKGRIDFIHSMGYGDLYEASTEAFTPPGGVPCANGAPIFKFSWQTAYGLGAGFPAAQLGMGLPSWVYEWGGSPLPRHLDDLAKLGAAAAIWDIPGMMGDAKESRWSSEAAWKALAAFKARK